MDSFRDKISLFFKKGKAFLNFWFKSFKDKKSKTNFYNRFEQDRKLVLSLSKSKIPSITQLRFLGKYLSKKELWILRTAFALIVLGSVWFGARFYFVHREIVPILGGQYKEALIGAPKYINPLYQGINDNDNDIMRLVFSPLFKRNAKLELVPDLAKGYSVSDDGKIYLVNLREDVYWHDSKNSGDEQDLKKLTADDVIFTFKAINNRDYQSTLRQNLTGINIEKIDDYQIKFTLSDSYAAFLEILTFGIIPEHVWSAIPPSSSFLSDLNLRPVGSGPYKFKSLIKDKVTGKIQTINLTSNLDYYNNPPYIEDLSFRFFPSYEEAVGALNENLVDGLNHLPKEYKEKIASQNALNLNRLNTSQSNIIFLNQDKNPALTDKSVRQALVYALDREKYVVERLDGLAKVIDGPILPMNFAYSDDIVKYNFDLTKAAELIKAAGWEEAEITQEDLDEIEILSDEDRSEEDKIKLLLGKGKWLTKINKDKKRDYLIIELSSANRDDTIQATEHIKEAWEKLGIKTVVRYHETKELQSEIIKSKDYQALFFGIIMGADPDIYAFWHSTQKGENGLNMSNYSNPDLDELLEQARISTSSEIRLKDYQEIQKIITEEVPAIFFYSPYYIYLQNKKIKNFHNENILTPSDRFIDVETWYIETGNRIIWKKN